MCWVCKQIKWYVVRYLLQIEILVGVHGPGRAQGYTKDQPDPEQGLGEVKNSHYIEETHT